MTLPSATNTGFTPQGNTKEERKREQAWLRLR